LLDGLDCPRSPTAAAAVFTSDDKQMVLREATELFSSLDVDVVGSSSVAQTFFRSCPLLSSKLYKY